MIQPYLMCCMYPKIRGFVWYSCWTCVGSSFTLNLLDSVHYKHLNLSTWSIFSSTLCLCPLLVKISGNVGKLMQNYFIFVSLTLSCKEISWHSNIGSGCILSNTLFVCAPCFVPHRWYTCTRPHFYHMWYIPRVHIKIIKCHCFKQLYTYTRTPSAQPTHPLLTTPTLSLLTKTKDNTVDSREQHPCGEHYYRYSANRWKHVNVAPVWYLCAE